MDQLRQDVGTMVEKITKVITTFRNFRLTMQEYVCLKVIAMVTTQEGRTGESDKIYFFNFIYLCRKCTRQRVGGNP